MDHMCQFENHWDPPRASRWLYKISLLLVFEGQQGQEQSTDKKRLACAQ